VSPDRFEVAILGAGIVGCALAYHLGERSSAGAVAVYDPRTPAGGATGRAAGIVTEQLWNRWDVEVARASKEEYAALAARWDPSAYTVNGFVRWTRDPVAEPILFEALERMRGWGVPVERWATDELRRRVPWGTFDDVRAGIGSSTDGVVTPSTMTEIYAEAARQHGVDFRLGLPFGSIDRSDDRWELTAGGTTLRSRHLVVAAGAWSKRLLQQLGHPVPLTPYRTQAAELRPARPSEAFFPSVHDIDLDVYVRPESHGRILAGDGTERVEADPERYALGGDERFVAHLAESFASRFPGWADAELVRAWAGVCASTPDRRPLIGPVPGAEGLFVAAGFNGFGVMRAAGVAQRLARLLSVGDGPSHELDLLEPVLPGRFGAEVGPFPPRPGFTLEAGDDPRF
jgi:sarcosine oxidase, subunit beta